MSDARTITLSDPSGRWHGSYGTRRCPAHQDRKPSLSVRDGQWAPIFTCHGGCSSADVAEALADEGFPLSSAGAVADHQERFRREADAREVERERQRQALGMWQAGEPAVGTLVEAYLTARAIRPPLPPTLRFHPALWNGERKSGLPAMLAAVSRGVDAVTGVHRTWLAEPGRKAKLATQKAMLGVCRGGSVRLTKRADTLIVAEGIETGLSLRDALQGEPVAVWAALSTSGVASLEVPDWASAVVAAPDADPAGRKAAERLGERCEERGVPFRVMSPPACCGDWNDYAQREIKR